MVKKHGIIFIISAKNDGPLYTSIQQSYCIFYDEMIVIGSVFTAVMKKNFFNYFEGNENDFVYHSSSKGILDTGARGIDFTAPGAVITAVPQWCKTENRYVKGTSVATPIVTGLIACLLSALKANSIPYSPEAVKFVLSKTAFLPKNGSKLEFGNGIIQIDAAFEYFKTHFAALPKIMFDPEITFHEKKSLSESLISLFSFKNKINKKGILLVKNEKYITRNYCVTLKNKKCKKMIWILKTEPKITNFIEHSESIKNNMFTVNVNTNNLENGSINYVEIHGFDVSNPSIGSLFHLPITVIVPEMFTREQRKLEKVLSLNIMQPYNIFFRAPAESKLCILKLTHLNKKQTFVYTKFADIDRIFVSHKQRLDFTKDRNVCYCYFPVNHKQVYEISFYQIWCNERQMFNMELSFDSTITRPTTNMRSAKCKLSTILNKFFFSPLWRLPNPKHKKSETSWVLSFTRHTF